MYVSSRLADVRFRSRAKPSRAPASSAPSLRPHFFPRRSGSHCSRLGRQHQTPTRKPTTEGQGQAGVGPGAGAGVVPDALLRRALFVMMALVFSYVYIPTKYLCGAMLGAWGLPLAGTTPESLEPQKNSPCSAYLHTYGELNAPQHQLTSDLPTGPEHKSRLANRNCHVRHARRHRNSLAIRVRLGQGARQEARGRGGETRSRCRSDCSCKREGE